VTVTAKWLNYQEVNEKCFEPVPYDDTEEGLFEKEENLSTVSTSRCSEAEPGFVRLERRSETGQVARLQSQQETKGVLKIIVKDTGIGMKKEAFEKLFQRFSQVSENVSQRNIGTGLGLFITREICLAMRGEIRAYSKFGVGSTFIVCIPMTTIPSDSAQRVNPEAIIRQLMQRNLKALVADDSPFNVDLITNYFSQFGASVISRAYNGYDAFMRYKEYREGQNKLDVVTLDIDMPIMDGRTVCDKIREYEKENRLKPAVIILISGNYDEEQIEEYLGGERGHRADCFLRKPVSFSEFNKAVYNFITREG
jgi:CheY-like chemotaxis protein